MKKVFSLGFLTLFAFISITVNAQELIIKKSSNGKWGLIDKLTEWYIQPQLHGMSSFLGGIAFAQMSDGGDWGIFDKSEKNFNYLERCRSVRDFSEGIIAVQICTEEDLPVCEWGFQQRIHGRHIYCQ